MKRITAINYLTKVIDKLNQEIKELRNYEVKRNNTPEEKLLLAIFGDNDFPEIPFRIYKSITLKELMLHDLEYEANRILSGQCDDEISKLETASEFFKYLGEFEYPAYFSMDFSKENFQKEYNELLKTCEYTDKKVKNRMKRLNEEIKANAPKLILQNEKRCLESVLYEYNKMLYLLGIYETKYLKLEKDKKEIN